jgi:sec-independent protein translocase protein TatA
MSDDSDDGAKDPKKLDKEEDAQFSEKVDAAAKEAVKDDKKAD